MNMIQEIHITPKSPQGFGGVLGKSAVEHVALLAAQMKRRLGDRVIWNVNSTAAGGGVAEMLHSLLAYARGLGVDTRWVVIGGSPDFFGITKRLHNALHGELGDGSALGQAEREIYERTAAGNAAELGDLVRPGDFVLLHDPQTAGLAPYLVERGARVLWRCHIGNDRPSSEEDLAWRFLRTYLERVHLFVFSRFSYVPGFCDHGRSVVVAPTIDPFSAKNQDLTEPTVRAILVRSGLVGGDPGGGSPTFARQDGSPYRVDRKADVLREGDPPDWDVPLVVQVSRWDRLKDPLGVLRGFCRALERGNSNAELVLAGPNVQAVHDDPEGAEVFEEVADCWRALPDEHRRRVHLANLPMDDLEENAAIVNALQRHAAIVVQKSLREGFGLTVTEAMWKARPLVASAVGGIRDQVVHGVSGLLLKDPGNPDAFASALLLLLGDPELGVRLGRNARQRVGQLYLGLNSLEQYADLIRRMEAIEDVLTSPREGG